MSNTAKSYEVRFVVVVDRPELRNESFAPVAPNTRVTINRYARTQGEAVRLFESILRGGEDYLSEYVAVVSVVQLRTNRSPRVMRTRVERTRNEHPRRSQMATLAVAAMRRGFALYMTVPSEVSCREGSRS